MEKNIPRFRISCIKKNGDHEDPFKRITHIGGIDDKGQHWMLPIRSALHKIAFEEVEFYVEEGGKISEVRADTRNSHEYLRTTPDGDTVDNLLELPDCEETSNSLARGTLLGFEG